MIGSNSCFPNGTQQLPMYGTVAQEDMVSSAIGANSASMETQSTAFLYNLSVLKDKVHQVQSLSGMFISSCHCQPSESTAMTAASMGTLIQEIIVTASSMMFTCQQFSLGVGSTSATNDKLPDDHQGQQDRVTHYGQERGEGFYSNETVDQWYAAEQSYNDQVGPRDQILFPQKINPNEDQVEQVSLPKINYDIVELDAADLLAKYTHYCQVCGKGFKRDANLRMHMRAHGDEYKSTAALSNPLKKKEAGKGQEGLPKVLRKYSCPQEGCRWNRKHAKFQPLKSMICVKNHYKRSHCPKMYVCNRCNRKQFSVLSDLRTHEKHCGDLKWQCSCGTTFSRKDKLMGHVALFVGHTPAINFSAKMEKVDQNAVHVRE